MSHLWEQDHPYYATEGCYYSNDCHTEHESWADFMAEMGSSDPDLNLLYRWDWEKPNPLDYDDADQVPDHDKVLLFFMAQRKARPYSHAVTVIETDEPAVREWLTERARTMLAIWAPILPDGGAA